MRQFLGILRKHALFLSLIVFIPLFLISLGSLWKIMTTRTPDFSVYYGASKSVMLLQNPYSDPTLFTAFNYPPATTLLYIPFTSLPYPLSQGIYAISSFLALFGVVYVSLRMLERFTLLSFLVFSTLALLLFPVKFTLGMGQSNLLALFFLLTGFWALKKEQFFQTGILLGIGILLKPVLIVCLGILFFRKFWVPILITLCILFVASALIDALTQESLTLYYITEHAPHLTGTSGQDIYYNQSSTGFIARLFQNAPLTRYVWILFSLILAGVYVHIRRFFSMPEELALVLLLILLIDPISWQHHLVFSLFPFFVLFYSFKTKLFRALLIFCFFLISVNIKNPESFPLLFLSHGFYGVVLLLFLLVYPKVVKS